MIAERWKVLALVRSLSLQPSVRESASATLRLSLLELGVRAARSGHKAAPAKRIAPCTGFLVARLSRDAARLPSDVARLPQRRPTEHQLDLHLRAALASPAEAGPAPGPADLARDTDRAARSRDHFPARLNAPRRKAGERFHPLRTLTVRNSANGAADARGHARLHSGPGAAGHGERSSGAFANPDLQPERRAALGRQKQDPARQGQRREPGRSQVPISSELPPCSHHL